MDNLSVTSRVLTIIITIGTAIMLFGYGYQLGGWLGLLPTIMAGAYLASALHIIFSLFKPKSTDVITTIKQNTTER